MREVWRELMFADEDQAAKATRDPVAPARRSEAEMKKAFSHTLIDGTPVHSFQTLMQELNHCAQYLSCAQWCQRGTHFRDHHHAQPQTKPRT